LTPLAGARSVQKLGHHHVAPASLSTLGQYWPEFVDFTPNTQGPTQHHHGLQNTAGPRQTASTTSSPGFHVLDLSYTTRSSSFVRLNSHGALPFLDRSKRSSRLFIRLPHAVRRQQCRGPPTSTPPRSSQEAAMHLRPWLHGQRNQLPLIPSPRS
jgi:hypothetical protein